MRLRRHWHLGLGLSLLLLGPVPAAAASAPPGEHVADEVLVRFAHPPSSQSLPEAHSRLDTHTVLVRSNAGLAGGLQALLRRWRGLPEVREAEPNLVFRLQAGWQHRDLRGAQGALGRVLRALPRGTTPVVPVRVGILDSGIDPNHPDLLGHVTDGVNLVSEARPSVAGAPVHRERLDPTAMDYSGHGTAVASLIGAEHDGVGIDGICPQAELVPIKIFDGDGYGTLADVVRGIAWAQAHRIDVLNMSFGAYESSPMLAASLAAAEAQGMLLVAAAGNDAVNAVALPASHSAVLAVGSADSSGISRFSNFGAGIGLFAGGEALMAATTSALGPHVYAPFTGTSAAAAQVSGLLALLLSQGYGPEAAQAHLQQQAIATQRSGGFGRERYAMLPLARILAAAHQAPWEELAVVALHLSTSLVPNAPLQLQATVRNLGSQATAAQAWVVDVRGPQGLRSLPLPDVPPLAVDAEHRLQQALPVPEAWLQRGSDGQPTPTSLAVSLRLANQAAPLAAPQEVAVRPQPQAALHVRHLGLQPLARSARDVRVQVENRGNQASAAQPLQIFALPAVHEGVFHVEPTALTRPRLLEALAPGASTVLLLPLTGTLPETHEMTLMAELRPAGAPSQRALQPLHLDPTGSMRLMYNEAAHMGSVEAAVDLLALQGLHVPDLHAEGSPYRGSPETSRNFGSAIQVGASNWSWQWARDWPIYPANAKHLIDGASASDGIDVAYGDAGANTWSTHYWIVGEGDDAGLTGHSALTKIYALLLGGHDSRIDDGAIAAYRAGDHARAWWLMGHAAHMLGDLSTGAHTLNRNWHGVVGDPYHDWMGHDGHFRNWPAAVVYDRGGMVDPYLPMTPPLTQIKERLRFLAYTTARIGAAFPWHRKRNWLPAGGNEFADGNRAALGSPPHYDGFLLPILDRLNAEVPRPLQARAVGRDELMDSGGQCVARHAPQRGDRYADCWDGGDGHVDQNNAREPGDADGDLSRIADVAYVYAVRAVAGLIYLFAVETGQLPPPVPATCAG